MSCNQAQLRYWFDQALEVETHRRLEFLERNCGDGMVRAEVLSLIRCDSELPTVVDVVRKAVGTAFGVDTEHPPVSRVGRFQIGQLLGSGGMGLVYEGHRIDGEVQQRVAIKFAQLSPAAGDKLRESVIRRFAREREMLASLRHPYIAGLIDAGTTDEGIPYAVIEQVDGIPIDAYCDAHVPHDAGRIALFLKLCEAVQFAHRNLVVHSDIKPDNVLVTADGNPKLIDFGVACHLDPDGSKPTMQAFTPGYASPEQCLGLPVTLATDVYGLGAVLYRLLTRAVPRRRGVESLQQAIRQITDEEVPRASTVRPDLKGDLENILAKAQQREPGRRYGSVPEFVSDLRCYLDRRPVSASPDSWPYRSGRFIRRHWVPMLAIFIVAAALIVATGVSYRQKRDAMNRAAETRRLAECLLFEVHDEIANVAGGTRAREKLGEVAVQYLEGLERDQARDPELIWDLVHAYSRLAQNRGGVAASTGDSKGAAQLATKALTLGALIDSAAANPDRVEKLFDAYNSLTPIFLEASLRAEHRETVDRMLRLALRLGPLRQAQAEKQLARFYDETGQPREGSAAWARALAALRALPGDTRSKSESERELISTLVGYGRAQALSGDFTGAVTSLKDAIALLEVRMSSGGNTPRSARQLYWSHITLGDVFGSTSRFSLGRTADAAAEYRIARAIAETLAKEDPANDMAKADLARAYAREGMALSTTDPAAALDLLDRSRDVANGTSLGNYSGLDARFLYLTASVPPLAQLGRLETARARLSEARSLSRELGRAGVAVDRKTVLRAEAVLAHASGLNDEALRIATEHLALLPAGPDPLLSENYAKIELLERVRVYASGAHRRTCLRASEELARLWSELRTMYPGSEYVSAHADRAAARHEGGCGVVEVAVAR
jgi:eukaryotic-like serine/threonine-protein kinase